MAVKVKGTRTVKPAKPTWSGRVALSELDQTGMITHVPLIYFYRPNQDWLNPAGKIFTRLTNTLSEILVPFYPLAGRLHSVEGGRLELDCNAAGARVVEAESDAELDDFGDFSQSFKYQSLIPEIDYSAPIEELPLLAAQVTRLRCGGVSLGFMISHAVTDGAGILSFFIEWVNLARGDPLGAVPFTDRKALRAGEEVGAAPRFDHSELHSAPLLLGCEDSLEERRKDTAVARLKLSRAQVEMLKDTANRGRTAAGFGRAYSRYESLTAHVWRCACKARRHLSEQPTALSITVDARGRMRPPLPREYFGNAIVDMFVTGYSGELVSQPLSFTAARIRAEIEKVTDEYVNSLVDFFKAQQDLTPHQDLYTMRTAARSYYDNPNIAVVSWLGMPLYGLDLGWGKELYMGLGKHDFDGDVIILPSYDGDGSLVVSACLQVVHMDAFKEYFYEDINEGAVTREAY